jgi:hypothetical protein
VIGVEHYDGLPAPTGARSDAEHVGPMMHKSLGLAESHVRVALDERAP